MFPAHETDFTVESYCEFKGLTREEFIERTLEQKIAQINKIRNVHLGKKLTDEHKRSIGQTQTGKVHSEETREKIRQAHLGKPKKKKDRSRYLGSWGKDIEVFAFRGNMKRATPKGLYPIIKGEL